MKRYTLYEDGETRDTHAPDCAALIPPTFTEEDGVRTYYVPNGPTFQIPAGDAEKIAARPLSPGEEETISDHFAGMRRDIMERLSKAERVPYPSTFPEPIARAMREAVTEGRKPWAEMTANEIVADMQGVIAEQIAATSIGDNPVSLRYLGSFTGRYWQRRAESNRRRANRTARQDRKRGVLRLRVNVYLPAVISEIKQTVTV